VHRYFDALYSLIQQLQEKHIQYVSISGYCTEIFNYNSDNNDDNDDDDDDDDDDDVMM